MSKKFVYLFAEGDENMRDLLGGKGANLAQMSKLGMPVDYIQGMTYTLVRACVHYALFGDEDYLQLQLNTIRISLKAYTDAGNIGG